MSVDLTSVPVAPADPTELRRCAQAVRQAGAPLRLNAEEILFAWGLLPAVYRAPEASDLQGAMVLIGPAAVEVTTGLALACDAVENLADELDAVNRERDALVLRLERRSLPGLREPPVSDDPFARRLADEARADAEAEFRRQCTALVGRWEAAVDACAAALRAIPDVPWSLSSSLRVDEQALESESTSITDAAALPLLDRLTAQGGAGAAALIAAHPEWVAVLRRAHPEAVARWWNSLPPTTAQALSMSIPAVIGNLDGVDIAARVAANRSRAAERLEELRGERLEAMAVADRVGPSLRTPLAEANRRVRELDLEIAYFQAVQAGRKQLYAWDPAHGSLIEMSGDPSHARSALFVLPGTNTRAESFFGDDPITGFADWQVRNGDSSVVAFTALAGPMPQLDELPMGGPQLNTYATTLAPTYASVVQGVKATRPDLWTMSYEHSYAGAVGSAAEASGGTVNARFLAAAVGAVGPYTPAPGTVYYAAQAVDDINRYYAGLRAGDLGFDVRPESFPGVHIVDPHLPGPDLWKLVVGPGPGIVLDSVQHHNALMSDDESVNGSVLQSVRKLLKDGGN
ncbi:MAG: hypothetical protein PIR02_14765 [Microbacterium enclense]